MNSFFVSAAPDGPARVFAALIVLCAGAGLLLASRVLEGPEKRRRDFFCYYTNQSNALILVCHILLLVPGPWDDFLRRPGVQLTVTLCIFVTFLIYFCVLTRFGRHQKRMMAELGTKVLSNALVHYVTPLLTVAEWLLLGDKAGLGLRHTAAWLVLPLGYFLFAVLRARTGRPIGKSGRRWPYGFMDKDSLGARKWWRNILLVMAAFWLLGLGFVGLAAIL